MVPEEVSEVTAITEPRGAARTPSATVDSGAAAQEYSGVTLTWHEQVAAAFRASKRQSRGSGAAQRRETPVKAARS
jgi:hypothetical protein